MVYKYNIHGGEGGSWCRGRGEMANNSERVRCWTTNSGLEQAKRAKRAWKRSKSGGSPSVDRA